MMECVLECFSVRLLKRGLSSGAVWHVAIRGAMPTVRFVHRNIANMVNTVDVSAMSVIQYAIGVLKVRCRREGCERVEAYCFSAACTIVYNATHTF